MVANVFKTIMIFILIMVFYDVTLTVTDITRTNKRVNDLVYIMKDELARNNSMPSEMVVLFNNQLQDIVNKSNIATAYSTNFDNQRNVNGLIIEPINEAHIKDYGAELTLMVSIKYEFGIFNYTMGDQHDGGFLSEERFSYFTPIVEKVPALRYLK